MTRPDYGGPRRKRRPEGVNESLWAYATSQRLAEDETATFAEHPLIQADLIWVRNTLGPGPGLVADLGCGSGRASGLLAKMGWNVIAIDLSRPMLARAMIEQDECASRIMPVQANLARLQFIPERSLDAAVCLFSTLGMIPRKTDRQKMLAGIAAALKPGGRFLLHAHNWFVQKNHAQGRRWMVRDFARKMTGSADYGNRDANYRGIPGIQIHMFRWRELQADLETAGFQIRNVMNLHHESAVDIGSGWLNQRIRAGGWLIEAIRDSK